MILCNAQLTNSKTNINIKNPHFLNKPCGLSNAEKNTSEPVLNNVMENGK